MFYQFINIDSFFFCNFFNRLKVSHQYFRNNRFFFIILIIVNFIVIAKGSERVAEVARMLGGERAAGTSLAHAQALLRQHELEPALVH